ncbi:MAG TPA: helix-turn-helix domain-containing protein [Candidatus Ratteibacteria bacterium]|nr:helix-turn-helix domain-containing protein [Candidatus Ratteibacteria bacterium]
MAKTTAEIEKFIELRAQGLSYDRIAEETGTSKPTLLKWSSQYGRELEQAQYFELHSLLAQYGLLKQQRVESVSVLLQAVIAEMKKRAGSESLSRLPTDKLFSLYLALEGRLKEETETKKIDFSPLSAYGSQYEEVEVD